MTRLVALFIFSFAVMPGTASGQAASPDSVTLRPASVDFGTFDETAAPLTREVIVRNAGKRKITVIRTYAGCGCITASAPELPRELAPGEELTVSLILTPGLAQRGKRAYELSVTFDSDGAGQIAHTQLVYDYNPEVEILATDLVIDGRKTGVGPQLGLGSASFRIIDHPPLSNFKITSVESSHEALEWSYTDVTHVYRGAPVRWIDVSVFPSPATPVGQLSGWIALTTDHPSHPRIQVPVEVTISGPLYVSPHSILVRDKQPGAAFERAITLTCETPFVIGEPTSPDLLVKTEISADGKKVVLTLTGHAPPAGAEAVVTSRVTIPVKSPIVYEIVVPVNVVAN